MSARLPLLVLATGVAAALAWSSLAAQAPQAASLVITNGIVITVDGSRRILNPGAVAIAGNSIVAVDTAAAIAQRYKAADVIDAAGKAVMPGLINTHTHAAMVMFRGLGNDLALMDWLQKYIFPAEAKTVTPEFVRIGTQLALLEMIQSKKSRRRPGPRGCAACSDRR
jgi:5-methylthioadenosine/S-adenosylhomocysteine deaminase